MKTHRHQELVGVVSGQEGHEHILQEKRDEQMDYRVFGPDPGSVSVRSHPVVCRSDHQGVGHQDGGFGLLDV